MKHALGLQADFHLGTDGMAFVIYRQLRCRGTRRPHKRVIASVTSLSTQKGKSWESNSSGLPKEAFGVARTWAAAHDLVFPELLAPRAP